MARMLKNIKVDFISLVRKPANGKGLVLKGADGDVREVELKKLDDEMQRAYGIVYAPNQLDSQEDYADADEIRKASDDFMRGGRSRNVDTNHSYQRADAYIAESWIVKEEDPTFPHESDVGAWAVGIQVTSPQLWKSIKKGEMTGISLAGNAQAIPTQKEETPGWFKHFVNRLGITKSDSYEGGDEMDKETEKLLVDTLAELKKGMDELKTAVEKSAKPDTQKAEPQGGTAGTDLAEMVKGAVADATKDVKTELQTEIIKTLGDALARGRAATGTPGASEYADMV